MLEYIRHVKLYGAGSETVAEHVAECREMQSVQPKATDTTEEQLVMEDKESESASARFYAKELKKLNEYAGVEYTSIGEHAKLIRKDIEAGKKGPNAEGFKIIADSLEDLERDRLEEHLSGPMEIDDHEIAKKRHRKRLIEVQEQINKLTKILNELEKE